MARPAKGYIQRRGEGWTVTLQSPADVAKVIGFKFRRVPLQALDRPSAEIEALAIMADHKARIAAARGQLPSYGQRYPRYPVTDRPVPSPFYNLERATGRFEPIMQIATEESVRYFNPALREIGTVPNGAPLDLDDVLRNDAAIAPPPLVQELRSLQKAHAPKGKTVTELSTAYLANHSIAISTRRAWDQALKAFKGLHGDVEIASIDRQMAVDFYDGLPGKTATRNKLLTAMSTMANYAIRQGWIGANPFSRLADKRQIRKETESRQPFSDEELRAYFAKIATDGSTFIWTSRLLLFTGARLEEVAQLKREWVKEINGIHCIDLRQANTKNVESKRVIPIHARLIELGLLDFVKGKNGERLFDDLKEREGRFSFELSKTLNRRIKSACPNAHNVKLHSFRATFKVKGLAAKVEKTILDIIQGHKAPDVSAAVYLASIANDYQRLKDEIDRIRFPI